MHIPQPNDKSPENTHVVMEGDAANMFNDMWADAELNDELGFDEMDF